MSKFRITDSYVSQKEFARLPKIGDSAPQELQPRGSLDSGSISNRLSGISSQCAAQIEEGDLVSGTIDITHERAYMLPVILDEDRAEEKKALVRTYFSPRRPNLTCPLPPGGAHCLPEYHTVRLSGWLDVGSLIQRHFVYVLLTHIHSTHLMGCLQCLSTSTATTTLMRPF